jgi:alkylhydroperoxidase/carboxymuconolactone decarboxylase family protein YurZ
MPSDDMTTAAAPVAALRRTQRTRSKARIRQSGPAGMSARTGAGSGRSPRPEADGKAAPRMEEAKMTPIHAEANPFLAWQEQSLQQKARSLLSVADCVAREGWGDAVVTHLRQAAHDLLALARPEEPAG